MKPLETTPIEPATGTPDGPRGKNKRQRHAGRSGDARKISQLSAALAQSLTLDESRMRKMFERLWILLRMSNADTVLADSRKITDDDRDFLIEIGGPKTLLKGGS